MNKFELIIIVLYDRSGVLTEIAQEEQGDRLTMKDLCQG